MKEANEINEWRYETIKSCKTAWTKWTFKTRRRTKTNLCTIIIKNLHWYIKEITNSTNKIIVWVCVCVSNSTKLQKNYMLKCPFFMIRNGQFHLDWKASHSHCIWMSARPIHGVAFLSCIHAEGSVLPLRRNFVKENKGVWRRRIYRKYASCRWLRTKDSNLRADVVLSMSRGPSGQWFPRLNMWASAIFVGTSGIPP